jgi:hypothetical protein
MSTLLRRPSSSSPTAGSRPSSGLSTRPPSTSPTRYRTVQALTLGSTRQIPDSANNRFAISGTDVVAGTNAASIAAATVYNITLRETLNGITKDSPLTVTVP